MSEVLHTRDIINEAIQTATREHIPTKKICTHNKPFWKKLLRGASKKLRNLRKVFKYNFSPRNGIALEKAKKKLKDLLQDSAAEWMSELLEDLVQQKSKSFWDSFKKILGNQRAGLDQLTTRRNKYLLQLKTELWKSKRRSLRRGISRTKCLMTTTST